MWMKTVLLTQDLDKLQSIEDNWLVDESVCKIFRLHIIFISFTRYSILFVKECFSAGELCTIALEKFRDSNLIVSQNISNWIIYELESCDSFEAISLFLTCPWFKFNRNYRRNVRHWNLLCVINNKTSYKFQKNSE